MRAVCFCFKLSLNYQFMVNFNLKNLASTLLLCNFYVTGNVHCMLRNVEVL